MKVETAKEAKIREAYGEYWDECKNYIDSNGWIKVGTYHENEPIDFEMFEIELESVLEDVPFGYFSEVRETVRPKSLSGIENNRGWIRIESEADLPNTKKKTPVWFIDRNGEIKCDVYHNNWENQTKWFIETFTHYQPIIEIPKPLY